jgi:antitoxin ParD1/3/4
VPTRNVNLTEHFDRFVEAGIASGRFSNASEVVREGLRLPEQREREDWAKIAWLRAAAEDGFDDIERGDYVTLRSGREIDDLSIGLGKRRLISEKARAAVTAARGRVVKFVRNPRLTPKQIAHARRPIDDDQRREGATTS